MNEGEKAGLWAMAYLYMALFVVGVNIVRIVSWHIKEWFL